MKLLEACLSDNLAKYKKDGVRVRVIGQRERLPKSLQEAIIKTEEATKNNSNIFLNFAISYGGRWDILNAVKKIIQDGVPAEKIDESLFESYPSTAGLPAPDLSNKGRRRDAYVQLCLMASRLCRTVFLAQTLAGLFRKRFRRSSDGIR